MNNITDRYIKALSYDQLRELHLELITEIQKRQLVARSIGEYNKQLSLFNVELRD